MKKVIIKVTDSPSPIQLMRLTFYNNLPTYLTNHPEVHITRLIDHGDTFIIVLHCMSNHYLNWLESFKSTYNDPHFTFVVEEVDTNLVLPSPPLQKMEDELIPLENESIELQEEIELYHQYCNDCQQLIDRPQLVPSEDDLSDDAQAMHYWYHLKSMEEELSNMEEIMDIDIAQHIHETNSDEYMEHLKSKEEMYSGWFEGERGSVHGYGGMSHSPSSMNMGSRNS